jgi:hypothetical protein
VNTVARTRHQARLLFAIALLASGLGLVIGSFFDPFGREQGRADFAARQAAGTLLCIQEDAFRARLDGLTAIEQSNRELSLSDVNLKEVLVSGLDQMGVARGRLNITCPSRSTPPGFNPATAPGGEP